MITLAVCIPTHNRPRLLQEAIKSCFDQTRSPDEICVEDNSPGDATEHAVRALKEQTNIPIVYTHTRHRLPQAENFNNLIHRVSCSHLLLLHDDDSLLPNAIHDLSACWDRLPGLTAAYGKQYVISEGGKLDLASSERMNANYHRTADREGLQKPSWFPGIVQQFPNDGYMICTAAATEIMWRPSLGNGCEFDFGLRLCLRFQGIYFVNKYTTNYRVNSLSMSASINDNASLRSFWILHDASLPDEAGDLRRRQLNAFAPQAVSQAVRRRETRAALRIYLSEFYPWSRRLTFRSISKLAEMVVPTSLLNFVRMLVRGRSRVDK